MERELSELRVAARAGRAGPVGPATFSLGDVLGSLGLDKWKEERLRAAAGDLESGASKKTDDGPEATSRFACPFVLQSLPPPLPPSHSPSLPSLPLSLPPSVPSFPPPSLPPFPASNAPHEACVGRPRSLSAVRLYTYMLQCGRLLETRLTLVSSRLLVERGRAGEGRGGRGRG